MRIHHLECGTMCPIALFRGPGSPQYPHRLVCHCLLIESDSGLILVDSGFGLGDVAHPYPRLSRLYRHVMGLSLREDRTAVRQIQALGFRAPDVRHIVVTHLDFDHAGGLRDFPEATVHVYKKELEAARRRHGLVSRGRYRPRQLEGVRWATYRESGETWFGFRAVKELLGVSAPILLVPLVGHTWGHCGVAVREQDRWLLHAGDAYFFHGEMARDRVQCPAGLRLYQTLMEVSRRDRLTNQARLRALKTRHGDEVRVTSAHDPVELEAFLREQSEPLQRAS